MPFEDPKDFKPKSSLKPIPGPKSMFDGKPKSPTPQQFEKTVQQVQEQMTEHKKRATELFMAFNKMILDKTLPQNRNILMLDAERETLQSMIRLAQDVNNDPNEAEGEGTLMWIVCLLKTCLSQRDRINELEYTLSLLQKSINDGLIGDMIKREIAKSLDNAKTNG
jgi:DNA repair ATPase RecN